MTSPTDLYSDLEIPHDADPAAIKRAYRKRAKETHPDKTKDGGEAFHAVGRAYLILRDPERRAKYDRTGSADETIDNSWSKMVSLISQIFMSALENFDPEQEDLVKFTQDKLKDNLDIGAGAIAASLAKSKRLEKARKRLKFKGDKSDILVNLIDQQLAENECHRANIELDLQIMRDGEIYLKHYSYKVDPKPVNLNPYGQGQSMNLNDILRGLR